MQASIWARGSSLLVLAELLFQLADYLIKSSLGERIIRLSGQAARYSETPL
jgi:hypothetical protein